MFDFYEEVIVANKHYYFFDEVQNWNSESTPELAANYFENLPFYKFLFRFLAYFPVPSVNLYAIGWDILFLSYVNSNAQIDVWNTNSLQKEIKPHLFKCRSNIHFYPKKPVDFQNSLFVFSEVPNQTINTKDLTQAKFLILKEIHKEPASAFWKRLCAEKKATLCLDFFDWGVIFFDRPQPKQYFTLKS